MSTDGRGRAGGNPASVRLVEQHATGSHCARIAAISVGPSRVLMPVATAPKRLAAAYATAKSMRRRQRERHDVARRAPRASRELAASESAPASHSP